MGLRHFGHSRIVALLWDYQTQTGRDLSSHDFRKAAFTRAAEADIHPKRCLCRNSLDSRPVFRRVHRGAKELTAVASMADQPVGHSSQAAWKARLNAESVKRILSHLPCCSVPQARALATDSDPSLALGLVEQTLRRVSVKAVGEVYAQLQPN
jgi:hypothetical protein